MERPLRRRLLRALTVLAPITVIVVAWVSSSLDNPMEMADVALLLASVTVGAAIASWSAGLVTSLAAALSLTWFHTEPVHSLRISHGSDVLAVVLLGGLGLGTSIATALRVRRLTSLRLDDRRRARHAGLSDRLAHTDDAVATWTAAVTAAADRLALLDVRLEPAGTGAHPVVARRSSEPIESFDDPDARIVVPEQGAVVRFRDPRTSHELVLRPRAGAGAVTVDRAVVLAFADDLELALRRLDAPIPA
jgi:K+-sensing histidine kinase KdpD